MIGRREAQLTTAIISVVKTGQDDPVPVGLLPLFDTVVAVDCSSKEPCLESFARHGWRGPMRKPLEFPGFYSNTGFLLSLSGSGCPCRGFCVVRHVVIGVFDTSAGKNPHTAEVDIVALA